MDVYTAVASRRAVRGFTDRPVPRATLERVLAAAARTPSGANLQPWRIYVLTDAPLAELKKRASERAAADGEEDEREYRMYPPALLLCYIDRDMGSAQWVDLGMYLQTVMVLLRAEGLHSCPQMAWAVYHRTVAEVVSPGEELILFGGLSVGFEDPSVAFARIDRAPLAETVTFLDGADSRR